MSTEIARFADRSLQMRIRNGTDPLFLTAGVDNTFTLQDKKFDINDVVEHFTLRQEIHSWQT